LSKAGLNRVNRGGSWNNDARNCRSANRNNDTPENRNNNLGFRVASSSLESERIHRTGQSPVPGQHVGESLRDSQPRLGETGLRGPGRIRSARAGLVAPRGERPARAF